MNPLRPLLASVLLAALAMGGLVLPIAHDVAHGGEQAELAETIEATHGDHHHHELEDDHGTEAQPYCPEMTDVELVCALCQVHVAATLACTTAEATEPPHLRGRAQNRAPRCADRAAAFARGPPASIA